MSLTFSCEIVHYHLEWGNIFISSTGFYCDYITNECYNVSQKLHISISISYKIIYCVLLTMYIIVLNIWNLLVLCNFFSLFSLAACLSQSLCWCVCQSVKVSECQSVLSVGVLLSWRISSCVCVTVTSLTSRVF